MNVELPRDEGGATAAEYAIMASLIAVVIIAAVIALESNLGESYDCSAQNVDSVRTGAPVDADC